MTDLIAIGEYTQISHEEEAKVDGYEFADRILGEYVYHSVVLIEGVWMMPHPTDDKGGYIKAPECIKVTESVDYSKVRKIRN